MKYREEIHDYIQSKKPEIIETLKELVKIPSVRREAEENAPFGKECARVLEFTEKLYQDNGFETDLDQNGGYLLSYYGEGKKTLGIFAHTDVVPVSDDWKLTSPFQPIEKDGFLVGRGTLDDKSAVVASLYCAKIIKELQIPFNSRLIMFSGANEESGMEDIKNYVSKHTPPDFSLVADTAFPLYRGNKGMLLFNAVCNSSLSGIKAITGSNAKGAILGKIKVVFDYNEELYQDLKANESEFIFVVRKDDDIVLEAVGISKHTALPEGSLNAGGLAFKIMSNCEYFSEENRKQFKFLASLLSHYYGEAMGVENYDPEFGKLTLVNDMVEIKDGKLDLHFNMRFGAMVNTDELKETIVNEFSKNDFKIHFEREENAKITEIDNPMLQVCLETYKSFTGDTSAETYVNAGETYAVHLPCAVEIGTTTRWGAPNGLPEGHGAVHQPDECISIEGFLGAIELTTLMLLACDKELQKS